MARFDGKVAVVTGGSSGIGLEIARGLVREGARTIIFGRRQSAIDAAKSEVGDGLDGLAGDVTSMADLDRLFAKVRDEYGGLDILVSSAGTSGGAPLPMVTEAMYEDLMDLNVKSVLFTAQKALPLLRAPASIVLIGSVAGSTGVQGCTVYGASKAAIRSFARTWALELAPSDIRVNVIAPGITSTPLVDRITSQPAGADHLQGLIRARTAMGRLGRAEEIAAATLFLCSQESSFITGAELAGDGGVGEI
jgi:NAD(P)-dependent dehydrogenase (short-subunit alcohol dehydrogenase family)